MTYNVFGETLSLTQSINQSCNVKLLLLLLLLLMMMMMMMMMMQVWSGVQ